MESSCFDCKSGCSGTHAEKCRRLGQVHPPFGLLVPGVIDRNAMMASQSGHTLLRPSVAAPSLASIPVEYAGDEFVRTYSDKDHNRFYHAFVGMSVVVSAPTPRHTYFRMYAAFPVNDQNDLRRTAVNIGNYFVNESTELVNDFETPARIN
jgi:hypothetical protein